MASCNWKTVRSPLTPAIDNRGSLTTKRSVVVPSKIKKTVVPHLQVKCEKGHISSTAKSSSASRRDVMQCLITGVLSLALVPKPAEARISRLEIKKKILEKLQELREKARLSKPKTENGTKPPTEPSPEDKKSPNLLQELREKAGLSKPKTENGIKPPTEPKTENGIKPSPEDKKFPTVALPTPEGTIKPLAEAALK